MAAFSAIEQQHSYDYPPSPSLLQSNSQFYPLNGDISTTNTTMDCSSVITTHNAHSVDIKKRKTQHKSSSLTVQSKDKTKKIKNGEEEEKKASGYIHVRARRGQATDSHSLAERVRREKISERMKLLQAIVPGCDKVTGKALMLDEIINYVHSLQNQVEFLSMKLASANPMFYNFGVDLESLMVSPNQDLSSLANSANPIMLSQSQNPIFLPQVGGNRPSLWEMDEQRQNITNHYGSNTTLYSFP